MSAPRTISYPYTGLMAPVFTAFDEHDQVLTDDAHISAYAEHLHRLGVGAVLVNGTTGEGPALSCDERQRLAASWRQATRRTGQSMVLQIGGASVADVRQMARDAQRLHVDAVMLLPDLYFRPETVEALVEYCARVAQCLGDEMPLLYYHIPAMTGVEVNMPAFLDAAEAAIPNFCGLKYTSGDLALGQLCLRPGRSVFLGADSVMCAALALGFDSVCMTSLNVCPHLALDIMHSMSAGRADGLLEAQKAQQQLNEEIRRTLARSGDWVADWKAAMNEDLLRRGTTLSMGERVRRPRMK